MTATYQRGESTMIPLRLATSSMPTKLNRLLANAILTGLLATASMLGTQSVHADNRERGGANDSYRSLSDQPDQTLMTNDAPCGANTIAVINTDQNDQYTFCADGQGVAIMELLYDDGKRTSLLDEISDPLELLATVTPMYVDLPDHVLISVQNGQRPQQTAPFKVGQARMPDLSAIEIADAAAHKAACATPSLGFSMNEFINDSTYCGTVAGHSTSSGNSNWHAHGASALNVPGEGWPGHKGPGAYSADKDEEGDARYGRARVRSCGGRTKFRGWKKASPTTGSWSPIASYTVPAGYTYTMKWYSNSQHSLWMGYDADDIWFRADALDNNTSFGSYFYFLKYAWGSQCDMKF